MGGLVGYATHGCAGLVSRMRAHALFGEDFDLPAELEPEQAPEPEVIAPVLIAADLDAARAEAWAEGHAAGLAEAAADAAAALAGAAQALAPQLANLSIQLRQQVEEAASAIARLLLDTLATLFPALCARHGEAEARAVLQTVLPALAQEPAVTVRLSGGLAAALEHEVARCSEDFAERVALVADPAMAPGDVRVAWQGGKAVRDAAALWAQVAAVLAPAGLLGPSTEEIEHVG